MTTSLDQKAEQYSSVDPDFLEQPDTLDVQSQSDETSVTVLEQQDTLDVQSQSEEQTLDISVSDYPEVPVSFKFDVEDFSFLEDGDLPNKRYHQILVKDLPPSHNYKILADCLGFWEDDLIALALLKSTEINGETYTTPTNIYSPQIQRQLNSNDILLGTFPLKQIFSIPDIIVSASFGTPQERDTDTGVRMIPSVQVMFLLPVVSNENKKVFMFNFECSMKININHSDINNALQSVLYSFSQRKLPKDVTIIGEESSIPTNLADIAPGVYYLRNVKLSDQKSKDGRPFKAVQGDIWIEEIGKFKTIGVGGGAASQIKNSTSIQQTANEIGILLDHKGMNAKGCISHVLTIPKPLINNYIDIIPEKYRPISTKPSSQIDISSLSI